MTARADNLDSASASAPGCDEGQSIDDSGIDLEQIRRMLKMTPAQRLEQIEHIVGDLLEVWRLNGTRPLR